MVREMTVPISEYDIEMFKDLINGKQSSFTWTFDVSKAEDEKPDLVNINFVRQEE
tara:strand:+ start:136 stop:300 length:165 start_codon:yes stop_codon:yes gene_type:complete